MYCHHPTCRPVANHGAGLRAGGILDLELLQLIRKKTNLAAFLPHLRPELLQAYTQKIANGLKSYFLAHPEELEVDWAPFRTWFSVTYASTIPAADATIIGRVFDKLQVELGVEPVLNDVLDCLMRQSYAKRIGDMAEVVRSGTKEIADIQDLVTEYNEAIDRVFFPETSFAPFSLSAVAEKVSAPGLEWRQESLRNSLGPLRGGDFIIVAARPEVGKTTFGADQVAWFSAQLHKAEDPRTILWVNNEERSDKVTFRISQAILGQTQRWILDNLALAEAMVETGTGKGRIRVTRNDAGLNERRAIEAYLKDNPASLIVFDLLDKVRGFGNSESSEVETIGQAYLWARELGHKQSCPVIAFSQVSAEGEGMQWIPQSLLRGSKTDKPGEADAIVTIGKLASDTDERLRYLSVCKNKLSGPLNELFRHGKHVCLLRQDIARYEDI